MRFMPVNRSRAGCSGWEAVSKRGCQRYCPGVVHSRFTGSSVLHPLYPALSMLLPALPCLPFRALPVCSARQVRRELLSMTNSLEPLCRRSCSARRAQEFKALSVCSAQQVHRDFTLKLCCWSLSPGRAQEFKALQQHIDDLTEEKFMLQASWLV